jgi:hypothetical protein
VSAEGKGERESCVWTVVGGWVIVGLSSKWIEMLEMQSSRWRREEEKDRLAPLPRH